MLISDWSSDVCSSDLVEHWSQVQPKPGGAVLMAALDIERGFQFDGALVFGEQDILGDQLARPARKRRRAEQFIAEASALSQGDLVVHVDHGIGRYDGLEPVMAGGEPHDCLRVL